MRYVLHTAATQPIVKHQLQMERNLVHPGVVGCVQRDSFVWIEAGYSRIYYSESDIARMGEDGEKLLDPARAQASLEGSRKATDEYWKAAARLRTALGTQGAGATYAAYVDALRLVYAHIITSTGHVLAPVERELQRRLRERFGGAHEDAYHALTTPTDDDVLVRELRAWREVAQRPSRERILAHAMRFPLMLANTLSADDAIAWGEHRLAECGPDEAQRKIAHGVEYRRKLRAEQERLGDDPLARFLRDTAIARFELKACWNGEAFHMLPLFERIARKVGATARYVYLFSSWQEQQAALDGGPLVAREELERRRAYALVRLDGREVSLRSGTQALREKELLLPETAQDMEIHGSVANRGFVEGIAKVVRVDSPAELREIAQGLTREHILVTGMTNPTMLTLIDKVGGIVTDEGGITCHAAIIARERGLPCVVGCRRATLVLRDGDRIALDAERGIVRRIG